MGEHMYRGGKVSKKMEKQLKVKFYDDAIVISNNRDRDSISIAEYFNSIINEVVIDLEDALEGILKEEIRNEYYRLINYEDIKKMVKESRDLGEAAEKIYEYLFEAIEEAKNRVYWKIRRLLRSGET